MHDCAIYLSANPDFAKNTICRLRSGVPWPVRQRRTGTSENMNYCQLVLHFDADTLSANGVHLVMPPRP